VVANGDSQRAVRIEELRLRDDPLALATNVHHDRIVRELHDQARNDLTFRPVLGAALLNYRRLEQRGKAVGSGLGRGNQGFRHGMGY
jgi:hypothetical protein